MLLSSSAGEGQATRHKSRAPKSIRINKVLISAHLYLSLLYVKPHLNFFKMCVGEVCYHPGMSAYHGGTMLHHRLQPANLVSLKFFADSFFPCQRQRLRSRARYLSYWLVLHINGLQRMTSDDFIDLLTFCHHQIKIFP